jgi:hypothetical protein
VDDRYWESHLLDFERACMWCDNGRCESCRRRRVAKSLGVLFAWWLGSARQSTAL